MISVPELIVAMSSPSVVLEMIGKMATTVAHRTSATRVSFTQMMMSGAIATIGVTCSRIA